MNPNEHHYKRQIIYILGNGFDISAWLPTRYTDFIFLINHWSVFYCDYEKQPFNQKTSSYLQCPSNGKLKKEDLINYAKERGLFDPEKIEQINSIIQKNIWIQYFRKCPYLEPGWAGFEGEIKTALRIIDAFLKKEANRGFPFMSDREKAVFEMLSSKYPLLFKEHLGVDLRNEHQEKIESIRRVFLQFVAKELEVFCEAFRLYLTEFVERMELKKDPGIVIDNEIKTNIISLNYTHNQFDKVGIEASQIHMIHGSDERENNLVLGINDDKSLGNDFIRFKKFFQRIQKRTGSRYQDFFIVEPNEGGLLLPCRIIFFGHSLDPIDSDFITDVFAQSKNNPIYIHHCDQEDYEKKVINCVEIFGADKVIDAVEKGEIIFTDKDLRTISIQELAE